MRKFALLMGLFLSQSVMAADQVCVTKLASSPYCFSIASAEANCEKEAAEVQNIIRCLDGNYARISKLDPKGDGAKFLRSQFPRLCLATEARDTGPGKNDSLCDN